MERSSTAEQRPMAGLQARMGRRITPTQVRLLSLQIVDERVTLKDRRPHFEQADNLVYGR